MNSQLRNERHEKISKNLRKYHRIFSALLQFSRPQFDDNFPTAGIIFDRTNFKPIVFKFGTKFFDLLTDHQLEFLYCHEMSHILFKHGLRGKELDNRIANIAMDIVINEFLLKKFSFNEKHILAIDDTKIGNVCTYKKFENCFPENYKVGQNFEYYYKFLFDKAEKILVGIADSDTLDVHGTFDKDALDSVLNNTLKTLNRPELQSLKKITKEPGDDVSDLWREIDKILTQPNPKFEDMFKREIKHTIDKFEYNWFKESPILANFSSEYTIPNDTLREIETKEKIKLYLFLDTSGSCDSYAQRFFKLVDSIPESVEKHIYGFTTDVYEIKNRKIHSGGTSFYQIENLLSGLDKYPSQVVLITDGYAESVTFSHPSRVTVFLTEGGSRESFHQEEIKVINLGDVEN